MFVHKQRCEVHLPIEEMYSKLCTDTSLPHLTVNDMFWEQSPVALRQEMCSNGHTKARGLQGDICDVSDWRCLMTDSEKCKAC